MLFEKWLTIESINHKLWTYYIYSGILSSYSGTFSICWLNKPFTWKKYSKCDKSFEAGLEITASDGNVFDRGQYETNIGWGKVGYQNIYSVELAILGS